MLSSTLTPKELHMLFLCHLLSLIGFISHSVNSSLGTRNYFTDCTCKGGFTIFASHRLLSRFLTAYALCYAHLSQKYYSALLDCVVGWPSYRREYSVVCSIYAFLPTFPYWTAPIPDAYFGSWTLQFGTPRPADHNKAFQSSMYMHLVLWLTTVLTSHFCPKTVATIKRAVCTACNSTNIYP